MTSLAFTLLFVFFLTTTILVRIWLSLRQIQYVHAHRNHVPEQFASQLSLASHQKAADYTITKTHFRLITLVVDTLVLLGLTLFGGLQYLSERIYALTGTSMLYQIILLATFGIICSLINLPFEYYQQFVIEGKFGFNKMTRQLFITDNIKGALLGIALGLPLIWVILTLMETAGEGWWLYAWIFWTVFQFIMLILYPTLIAPLFNKFAPLQDDALRTRIENLMKRVGFASSGLFVMDGSKRSAHGNAYFTGLGSAKRVVFFDTLISRLTPAEVEAVLAHELGHFRLKHITKRMFIMCATSFIFLALLGYLKDQSWFYAGLGIDPSLPFNNNAAALILFVLTLPIFTFFLSPLVSMSSRKHEFEADAFAAEYTNANDMVTALVKMYEDNASTLTPDPIHSAFYDSHPPASTRIGKLLDNNA